MLPFFVAAVVTTDFPILVVLSHAWLGERMVTEGLGGGLTRRVELSGPVPPRPPRAKAPWRRRVAQATLLRPCRAERTTWGKRWHQLAWLDPYPFWGWDAGELFDEFVALGFAAVTVYVETAECGLYRGMWVVYGTTALIALAAGLARGTRSPLVVAVTTPAGSCLFLLLTNFAVWAGDSLYSPTADGLSACYAAIPFFRNALQGDAFYTVVLFGAWALAEAGFPALRPVPNEVRVTA